jgi:hypothetical protein
LGSIPITTTGTASNLLELDANANAVYNNAIGAYSTHVTNAGTITLTNASSEFQYFTNGTNVETVVLPVASTLLTGWTYTFRNTSTFVVTIQSSGTNTVLSLAPNVTADIQCILTTGTTAASWSILRQTSGSGNGIYGGSGSLTSNTTVSLAGFTLGFSGPVSIGNSNAYFGQSGTSIFAGAANGGTQPKAILMGGATAGFYFTGGTGTVAIGYSVGATQSSYTSMTDCIFIGDNNQPGANTLTNAISIGAGGVVSASNTTHLGTTSTTSTVLYGTVTPATYATGAIGDSVATSTGGVIGRRASGLITYKHTIFTPTTGGTVALVNNQYNIVNPSGALVALTVNLPSSPVNNDCVYIKYTQAITTVTYGNGTVVDGITAPTAGGLVTLTYDSGTTSWY